VENRKVKKVIRDKRWLHKTALNTVCNTYMSLEEVSIVVPEKTLPTKFPVELGNMMYNFII